MEPHDPSLGLPLQLQRESELHAPLLSMVEQTNFPVQRLSQQFTKLKSVKSIVCINRYSYLLTSLVGAGVGGGVGGSVGAGVGCITQKKSII